MPKPKIIGASGLRTAPGETLCPWCGSPFIGRPGSTYCSTSCMSKYRGLKSNEENLAWLKEADEALRWRDPVDFRRRKCATCKTIFTSTKPTGLGKFCRGSCKERYWHVKKWLKVRGHDVQQVDTAHAKAIEKQIEILRAERAALEAQVSALQSEAQDAYLAALKDSRYRHIRQTSQALKQMAKDLDVLRRYTLLPEASIEQVRDRLGKLAIATMDGAIRAFEGPTVLDNGEVVEVPWTPAHARTFESILSKVVPDANAVLATDRQLAETSRKSDALDKKLKGLSDTDQARLDNMSQDELSALLSGKVIEGEHE